MTTLRRLKIDTALFAEMIGELARRGGGTREAGAFLLTRAGSGSGPASQDGGWQAITAIAYYDDLDPSCLTGTITFTADGYTALAALCRRDGLQIAADIHTHPGPSVRQSRTDATHPMAALPGHVALIVPWFAQGVVKAGDLGAHHYQGDGQWTSRYDMGVDDVLRVTTAAAQAAGAARLLRRAADLLRRARKLITPRKPGR